MNVYSDKTVIKINKLRQDRLNKEMMEVKPKPLINKNSNLIANRSRLKKYDVYERLSLESSLLHKISNNKSYGKNCNYLIDNISILKEREKPLLRGHLYKPKQSSSKSQTKVKQQDRLNYLNQYISNSTSNFLKKSNIEKQCFSIFNKSSNNFILNSSLYQSNLNSIDSSNIEIKSNDEENNPYIGRNFFIIKSFTNKDINFKENININRVHRKNYTYKSTQLTETSKNRANSKGDKSIIDVRHKLHKLLG